MIWTGVALTAAGLACLVAADRAGRERRALVERPVELHEVMRWDGWETPRWATVTRRVGLGALLAGAATVLVGVLA